MAALTTTANLKAWVGLNGSADDAVLDRLVTSISAYVEAYLNRKIASATYTDVLDGTGTNGLMLPRYPVTAVSSVSIGGVLVSAAADDASMGYVWSDIGLDYRGGVFTSGRRNVRVTYTAGYSVTPPEIEQAVLELAALRYRERDRIGHSSKSIGGETVAYVTKALPDSVRLILDNWRNVTPV